MLLNRIPLEDELGDVLEKALRHARLTEDEAGARAGVEPARIRDAIDYRSELSCGELERLARTLDLNEVGLCALAQGRYPLPEIEELSFALWPLRMRHGIGVANAYVVVDHVEGRTLLFDVGPSLAQLEQAWPSQVTRLDAVFLTHVEAEHAGALCDVVARFGVTAAYVPERCAVPCSRSTAEGERRVFGGLEVVTFATPGHAAAHNCYLVRSLAPLGSALLISGDLIFAGSVGGGYFCCRQLKTQLHRVLAAVTERAVLAPGHGPLSTVEHERRYNPFVL